MMSVDRPPRLTYEDSCRFLQKLGYPDAGAEGTIPPLPDHQPQQGDEEPLGVSFFRTWVSQDALEDLSLPRTFFGKSKVGPISFRNTDFTESTMCWNDFEEVDFTDADLSRCDLRASLFERVSFLRANLQSADLRQSSFEDCWFAEADLRGAKLTRMQGKRLALSDEQRQVIDWHEFDGDPPGGG